MLPASCSRTSRKQRDDAYELNHAGQPLDDLELERVGCILERGTFMSRLPYQVIRRHPLSRTAKRIEREDRAHTANGPGVRCSCRPPILDERQTVNKVVNAFDVDYDDERERFADGVLGRVARLDHPWRQPEGPNRTFLPGSKRQRLAGVLLREALPAGLLTRRRIPTAQARLGSRGMELPGRWAAHEPTPFPNHMWETTLRHSLRLTAPEILFASGRACATRRAKGRRSDALAWAPPTGREFAYVTEHVSSDSAIAALERLFHAAQ